MSGIEANVEDGRRMAVVSNGNTGVRGGEGVEAPLWEPEPDECESSMSTSSSISSIPSIGGSNSDDDSPLPADESWETGILEGPATATVLTLSPGFARG